MKKFSKKQSELIVKEFCETHIEICGNTIYKVFQHPVDGPFGPSELYRFLGDLRKSLDQYYDNPNLVYSRPYNDFQSSSNLIPLIQKYGIKINISVEGKNIDTADMSDIILYYRYGIQKPGFVETIETYKEYKLTIS